MSNGNRQGARGNFRLHPYSDSLFPILAELNHPSSGLSGGNKDEINLRCHEMCMAVYSSAWDPPSAHTSAFAWHV